VRRCRRWARGSHSSSQATPFSLFGPQFPSGIWATGSLVDESLPKLRIKIVVETYQIGRIINPWLTFSHVQPFVKYGYLILFLQNCASGWFVIFFVPISYIILADAWHKLFVLGDYLDGRLAVMGVDFAFRVLPVELFVVIVTCVEV
jgi:hypothetical protein